MLKDSGTRFGVPNLIVEYHAILKDRGLLPESPTVLTGLQNVIDDPRTKGKYRLQATLSVRVV